ncbi:MAG TPA: sulfite exporter TauE/SafE family protein [Candidatus Eremiobacteraceae bacterium]|nr:sulfite exporter TauE/SafE family protein [Candidatus Eremiobacteraceae bacterium]
MNWFEIAGFVALGLVAGTYGTVVGVGGGLLIVPVLIFAHFAPKQAVGTSMAVVFANAVSGSVLFLRQQRVEIRTGVMFALMGLPGTWLGAYVDQIINRRSFSLLLGLFLFVMAMRLLFGKLTAAEAGATGVNRQRLWLALLAAFATGFLANLFGVGGGIIYVPTFLVILNFAAHVATATSTFTIALTALFGTVSHAYYGDIIWGPAVALAVGAVAGAQIGARLAPRIRSVRLIRLFSIAVFVTGGWLIYQGMH